MPDENAWVLPVRYREILPRRGGFAVPAEAADDPAEELRSSLRFIDDEKFLADDRAVIHDPDLAVAGDRFVRPWLATGEPGPADPRGAGVVVLTVAMYAEDVAELAVGLFGTGFGVRMVAEMGTLVATRELWTVDPSDPEAFERGWRAADLERLRDAATFVRARLAGAPGAEYDDARTVLAAGRTTPIGRILASFLLPTEIAWVDEDCAAAAGWAADDSGGEEMADGDHRWFSALLLFAASTTTHLELLRGHVVNDLYPYDSDGLVGTVLDGVGPEAGAILATPFFAELVRLAYPAWGSGAGRLDPEGIRMLAVIPTDEAFRALCRECFDGDPVRPAAFLKSGVLTRFPKRAARLLAELDAPIHRDLLAGMRGVQVDGTGVGRGWAELLDHARFDTTDDLKRAVKALAALPFEESFGLLIDRIDRQHFRGTFLAAARRHPEVPRRALRSRAGAPVAAELLRDHLLVMGGAESSTLPPWLVVGALPAPESITREALCELVAASSPGDRHPAGSAAFGWAVFEQWRAAEYPPKGDFAMLALATLGDDGTVPALTGYFPQWASSTHVRVRHAMEAIGGIGTDTALRSLLESSRKAPTPGLRSAAAETLGAVAQRRGVTVPQLLDRLVPAMDLSPLDYGPRRFTITLDDQLQPALSDERGSRLSRIPRIAATDDPSSASSARARWTALRKDLKTMISERRYALENAMVTGRRWSAAEFTELFVDHPLTWHLTRRLLWATFAPSGELLTAFRPAEDRTFADASDDGWTLDPEATVGLPHPWHLGTARSVWSTVFADYAIIQPFPQVGRELFTAADPAGFIGRTIPSGRLYSLTAQSWTFDDDNRGVRRDWPDGTVVQLGCAPGYHWQEPDAPQTLTTIHPAALSDLPPIPRSETIRDLHYLTS
ncbi:DUF4132 domain-containing protein [Actinoplanes couchii]|uniref:DUF4132 domain-containing protein n=1 Tax=Actinoplanes couchii TaxID=403638 RepID=A0ABQ3XGM0_9ACTN|nr:DUF4132 domain-containing protein [Actinoplanes couchii]MDR6321118.1 hypothetical protein [Actinoplanes couchii]GID57631.1 hypothetical protein Aco03nite_060350 [Actinoplanes couchii]